MINKKCMKAINKWLYYNEKLKEINNYLYTNTELFEQEKMYEYRESLFRFFAGKITRFSKDYNELMEKLSPIERKKMYELKIMEEE